ncbi:MAG TPA: SAF domain-containing protein [Trichormus sp.]
MPQHLNWRAVTRSSVGRANVQMVVLVVVVGVLLISAWIYLSNRPQHPGNMSFNNGSIVDRKMTPVVHAVKDIPAGTVITRDAIEDVEATSSSKIPANAVGSSHEVEGRVAKEDISSGQIITETDLGAKKRTARKSILRHTEDN